MTDYQVQDISERLRDVLSEELRVSRLDYIADVRALLAALAEAEVRGEALRTSLRLAAGHLEAAVGYLNMGQKPTRIPS